MIDKFSNILAIETTDQCGSVALLYGNNLLLDRKLPTEQRSAQSLAPAIDDLLKESKLLPSDIGKVTVVTGPGSFTGLRVGVVTAKVFAYAIGAEIIGLSTFEVIAFGGMLSGLSGVLSIGVDAQRGDVAVQDWQINAESENYCKLSEIKLMPINDWWQHSTKNEYGQNIIFAGTALRRFGSKLPETIKIVEENLFDPHAKLAAQLAKNRKPTSDIWTINPIYARPSAADEKLKQTATKEI
ncbi:MAG: tRNA (adenosine(37)-N6)-threonylcarbamoyltransferase complex dimerization subunit type 1 TsaB [Planctomycetaceae bacterium]|jgi:tRNA threonylcarbamoyladenosine biosynthesis protein TsaB|nr:tRNA (adenosine(37)-N6)-threonylcarbamoyltransferase complex dimerization subunit type 1 TsaB [Planctomycetaceae bacterium]